MIYVFFLFIREHVKFICPTPPTRNVQGFPGNPYNAWFNVNGLEDPFEDMEGLEASAAYAILDTRSLLNSGFNDAVTKPGFTHNPANTRVIEDTHDKLMNSNETIPLVHLCPPKRGHKLIRIDRDRAVTPVWA